MARLILLTAAIALAFADSVASGRSAAQPSAAAPALVIGGDVKTPTSVTSAELQSMPRAWVEVKDQNRTVTYEGVLLADLLKKAGAPLGGELSRHRSRYLRRRQRVRRLPGGVLAGGDRSRSHQQLDHRRGSGCFRRSS